ncbi:hypothetical protein ACTJIJ_19465 [Niabella sp. 22666]|uniref:hypothetical protein n=1 Tax=Niabella sp. 22666 TaxID=3453954 RepID=UPI003F82BE8A
MIKTNFKAALKARRAKSYLLTFAVFSLLWLNDVKAQTALNPGDICFVGYYRVSASNAGFSFVTLNRISRGTVIYITEMGVDGTTGWGLAPEGYIKWTVGNSTGQDLLPGAIVSVVSPQTTGGLVANMRTAAGATVTITSEFAGSVAPSATFNMSSGGDPLLVFQTKSPTKTFTQINDTNLPLTDVNFITGITTDYNTTTINPVTRWTLGTQDGRVDGITSVQESTVPPGLTNGVNCVSLGAAGTNENYAKYTGPLSGSRAQIIALMTNPSNWDAVTTPATTITLANFTGNVVLPVVFNGLKAGLKNGKLIVDWSTVSETNNAYFEVQGSLNGVEFVKLGTMASKGINGNSSQQLNYQFIADSNNALLLSGFGILTLLGGALLLSLRNRKAILLPGIACMFLVALGSSSCSKSVTVPDSTGHQQIFIRIAQVDKDGTTSFSKVINAVLQ